MKRVLVVLGFIIIGCNCFGQITPVKSDNSISIGKVAPGGSVIAELKYMTPNEKDTTYILLYKNQEYQYLAKYEAITFHGENNTLGQLYTVIKSVFLDENKKNKELISFELDKNKVSISPIKLAGASVYFSVSDKGFFTLNEKQVDKLFGKN